MRVLLTTLASLTLLAIAPSGAGASTELRGFVPLSYTYDVTWKPGARRLVGQGRTLIENRSSVAKRLVWIRLRANDGDRLQQIKPRRARIDRSAAGGSMVRLRLDDPILPGRSGAIAFDMSLRVPARNTSLGRSAGADLFGDAFPVVAVAGPRPMRIGPEPSYGEGSFNPVATWNVGVKAPPALKVILPGRQQSSSDDGHVSDLLEVRDFAFAIGRFRCESRSVDGVKISACGVEVARGTLRAALRRAVLAWSTMQRWYGGYNLPSLKVVVGDLPFGGSEYPGIVFSTPDNATIAHEVAHQWFYGLVGNDQYSDPFLDESLTAYAEQQFHRSYRCDLASPIDGRRHGLGTGMDYWQKHPREYEQTIYRGGACALTVLRRDIGEPAFQAALRAYVTANADKIAGVEDFLAAVRSAAPDYDLARWERLVGLD